MVSSARRILIAVLLLAGTAICISGQTTLATGSISGKVTKKGAPGAGITVQANDRSRGNGPSAKRFTARTDQSGSYRITNLPAGTYEVRALALALVSTNQSSAVVVAEGQEVDDLNIALVPGGVITGRITDADGEPVIGEAVNIIPAVETRSGRFDSVLLTDHSTDDRGIYRAFGLPAGKYRVSVGRSESGLGNSREYYKQTFYPSVNEAAKATVIEVTEGSETNNIDIVLGRPVATFRVAGRVVDGETGKPIANVSYGIGQKTVRDQSSSSESSVRGRTSANGEFRFENLAPGKYTAFTAPADGDGPAASISFEVVDRDLTDLLIKTISGGSLSGVVTIDGNDRAPALLSLLRVCARVMDKQSEFTNAPSSAVAPDGSFSINGVRSGVAGIWLCFSMNKNQQFEMLRVERNGIPFDTINLKEREHVSGIHITVKALKLTAAIRGQVKVENGELPPLAQLSLLLWPLDENLEPKRTSSLSQPELDARGRFFVDHLPAGNYRLNLFVISPAGVVTDEIKQQVTITDDTVTDVTLTIKPKRNPN